MSQIDSDSDDVEQITVTVDVDDVIFALEMNDTGGADDRVIAVPQSDGGEASIRRAFRGSERYSNPSQAPVHIKPEALVEDPWTRPPNRSEADLGHLDVPDKHHERTEEEQQKVDEAEAELISVWENDAAKQIEGEHSFSGKGNDITLVGVSEDE